jgi:hypothetical protein
MHLEKERQRTITRQRNYLSTLKPIGKPNKLLILVTIYKLPLRSEMLI